MAAKFAVLEGYGVIILLGFKKTDVKLISVYLNPLAKTAHSVASVVSFVQSHRL
jgi:hypothetical protein